MLKPFEDLLPEIASDLTQLEQRREQLHRQASQGWLMVGGIIVAGVVVGLAMFGSAGPIAGVITGLVTLISSGVVGHYQISLPKAEFVSRFKNEVIGPLAAKLSSGGLNYFPTGVISADVYQSSELFQTQYDRYKGEDLLTGTIDKTPISLSELHTEYKTTSTDSNGNTQTHWHTIFRGLFVVAEFPKKFQGKTFVRPDRAERAFGFLGRALQKTFSGSEALVQLEDPDFERAFVVNASDQVEARYILSTSMMKRMLELKEKFDAEISFAFIHSHVFIAVSQTKDMFEPVFSQNVAETQYLREYYDQLAACVSIVDDLSLNLRIWGKS